MDNLGSECARISSGVIEKRNEARINAIATHLLERANAGQVFAVLRINSKHLQDYENDIPWICAFF